MKEFRIVVNLGLNVNLDFVCFLFLLLALNQIGRKPIGKILGKSRSPTNQDVYVFVLCLDGNI